MGLFYLVSRLTVTSLGTLYPIYLSYKAIKANDLASLETLLMYWVVMGAVGAAEGTIEWVVNWIPFYYEFKTVAVLWLTLPQIQGSTYVYLTYIHPFLLDHEHDIDAGLAEAKTRAKQAGVDYLRRAGDKARELLLGGLSPSARAAATDASGQAGYPFPSGSSAQQYYSQPPASRAAPTGPAAQQPPSLAMQLLRQYGPAAYAAGAALLHPMANRPPAPHTSVPAPPPHAATVPEAATTTATEEQEGSLRKRNYLTRNRSSNSVSSTAVEPPVRPARPPSTQSQVDDFISREKARRAAAASSGVGATVPPAGASPGTPASAGGWALFGRRGGTGTPTPSTSTVDASSQQSRVASSPAAGERSLYGGFEEIGMDEAPVEASPNASPPSSTAPTKQGWFSWRGGQAAPTASRTKTE